MTQTAYARVRGAVLAVLVAGTALYCLTVVPGVRSRPGFDTRYDAWLQGTVYCLMALGSAVPVVLRRRERWFWGLISAALVLRTVGFLLYWTWIRQLDPQPYPSLSDAFWVASSVSLILGVALAVRRISPAMTRMVVLDGLTAALTAAAYGFAIISPTLDRLAHAGAPGRVVLTNLTYPVLDIALVAMVAGLLFTVRGDTSWATRTALVGMLASAAVDCVYLYEVTAGTWQPGTWVNALAMVAMGLMAMAAWWAPPTRDVEARLARLPHTPLETPIAFALLCTVLFALDAYREQPRVTMLLAAGAMLVAILRGVRTMSTDRSESRRVIRATDDERLKFQALVETSGDFIAIAGMDGRVAYLNPAGRRMIGMSPTEDVTRTSIPDYLTEEGLRASVEVEQPAVVSQGHWEGESTLRHRDGHAIPVEISSFLMHHPESGEPLALATVQRDITERVAAERELAALAEQRRQLLARLVQAEEAERSRIAADVHDDSVQALAVVDLRLGMLRGKLGDLSAQQAENLDRLHESVTQAIERLRRLLFDLEPPGGDVDLGTALADAAGHLFHGTALSWQVTGDGGPELADATRVTAYRIAKEAMVNVLKHAAADRVEIRVETCPERGGLQVSVIDDGAGFDEAARQERPGHLGLGGMSDRATIAGGRLDVHSAPGAGTAVRLWLPDVEPEA